MTLALRFGMVPALFAAGVSLFAACSLAGSPAPAFAAGDPTDYQILGTSPLKEALYHRPERFVGSGQEARSGAWSPNDLWEQGKATRWYIEQQRNGAAPVVGGTLMGVDSVAEAGFRAFDWGFRQQQADGGFGSTGDAFHSTSFFVEAVAHTLLVLEQSPQAGRYAARIAGYKPRLLRAARWMVQPQVLADGQRGNAPYTHRRYLVAAALGLTGKLCNDPALVAQSASFVADGLALQDPAGFNPERGGFDSSYDMVGIVYAERWLKAFPDHPLAPRVEQMIARNLAWEQTRVLPSGEVRRDGNTRTNGQEVDRHGKVKSIAYNSVVEAFGFWGIWKQQPAVQATAWQVARYARYL